MTMQATIQADLAGRRAAATANPADVPSTAERKDLDFAAQLRAKPVEKDGKKFFQLEGYASTVNQQYTMYDWFGPYDEKIDGAAFDKTLAANPDVVFLLNHRGTTMARTKAGTLELGVDDLGLKISALVNAQRQDVSDMVLAIDDGDIDQMSFAFRIIRGQWSPDYTEYTILEVDLDRGDVSAVNYGANPNTSIAARSKQALAAVEDLPVTVLRALVARGEERLLGVSDQAVDTTIAEDTGRSVSFAEATLRLELDD